jgi:hypothetical protein
MLNEVFLKSFSFPVNYLRVPPSKEPNIDLELSNLCPNASGRLLSSLTSGNEALTCLAAGNIVKLRSYQYGESAMADESPVCRNRGE